MNAAAALHDTNTREYNVGKFQELGLLFLAGKLAEGDQQRDAILRVLPAGYDNLTNWLAEDYDQNSSIVDSLASRLVVFLSTEQVMDIFGGGASRYPNKNLVTIIENNIPILRNQETIDLAARVSQMPEDDRSIETWAKQLAEDISKGND